MYAIRSYYAPPAAFPKETTEPPSKKTEETDEDLENFDLASVFLSSLDGAEENIGVSSYNFV